MGTMQIPNDPIQQALGPATAALGIENAWIAVAFILLVLLVLFVVLYLRKCRTLRRSLERIDDLEQQVLGLTAMTHLSGVAFRRWGFRRVPKRGRRPADRLRRVSR